MRLPRQNRRRKSITRKQRLRRRRSGAVDRLPEPGSEAHPTELTKNVDQRSVSRFELQLPCILAWL